MQKGTVKFYNKAKGFGFIIDEATKKDVFVHLSGLDSDYVIKEGDKVTFDLKDGKKGQNAVNVQVI
jgi:CspA family cold shock protein